MRQLTLSIARWLRHRVARSWPLSRAYYWLRGLQLTGRPSDEIWYFAYGANMNDSAFLERRGMYPLQWCPGCVRGYQLRFNLEGRPKGKAAPANICAEPNAEVWGVLYRITRANLVHLDATEGVPGPRYRHQWLNAQTIDGQSMQAVAFIADGLEADGNPSLRYITLLREGARSHGLPEHWLRHLDDVKHAQ